VLLVVFLAAVILRMVLAARWPLWPPTLTNDLSVRCQAPFRVPMKTQNAEGDVSLAPPTPLIEQFDAHPARQARPTEAVNLMPKVSWSKPLWDPIPSAVQRRMQAEAQARPYNHPRWFWARRGVGRALVAAYLVTLAGLATVGWIDALQGGQREGLTGTLWLAFFVAILVEQALLDKATRGLFKRRVGELDERRRAVRDLGYRYGFRILAVAATTIVAVALYLPVDRLLGATNRLQWLAIAIAVAYLVRMLPTILIAWITPDTPP
jgi:hypothetical protein